MARFEPAREGRKNDTADFQPRTHHDRGLHDGMNTIFHAVSTFEAYTSQGGVIYLLYIEVFSADSKTRHFNRAVDRIRGDARALELLGSGHKIRAFGEPTSSKWARARPIASTLRKDRTGAEHLLMHFNVEGSERAGVVHLHMIKRPDQAEFKYKYLTLNVKGQSVLYLENADAEKAKVKPGLSLFGARWR